VLCVYNNKDLFFLKKKKENYFESINKKQKRPLRMHSLRPVPRTITSYSSSMVTKSNLETNPFEDLIDTRKE